MRCISLTRIGLALLSGLLVSCSTVSPLKESTWKSNEPPIEITKEVGLVSDTQFHESRGTASIWWSLGSDEFVGVTIRSAQQVIGEPDVLAESLDSQKDIPLVVHLGDAIDVSCQTEWNSFKDVIVEKRRLPGKSSWVFTPGNHDGYLTGNIYPQGNNNLYKEDYWNQVCNAGRFNNNEKTRYSAQKKNDLIKDYTSMLQQGLNEEKFIQYNDSSSGIKCFGELGDFCIIEKINEDEPWRSFIVQSVLLPSGNEDREFSPIYLILLDTSNFDSQPKFSLFSKKAGMEAGITKAQLEAVNAMINNLPEDSHFALAGHHDYKSWQADTWQAERRDILAKIISHPRSLKFLLTSHTHMGGWFSQKVANQKFVELNLGSLIDNLIYYRTLKFIRSNDGVWGVESKPHNLECKVKEFCSEDESKLPEDGSGYSIKDQSPTTDRLRNSPAAVRYLAGVFSAIGKYFKFWHSKHTELKSHLLIYRDIVQKTMPYNTEISYPKVAGDVLITKTLINKDEVIGQLEKLAECYDSKECAVQIKGNLLLALEQYYNSSAPEGVRETAHKIKFCQAFSATKASAPKDEVDERLESINIQRMMLP